MTQNISNMDMGESRRGSRSREYFYIVATSVSGRLVVLGPYNDESEANQIGFTKIKEGNFEIVPIATSSLQTATRKMQYRRFEKSANLEDSLKRAQHKIGGEIK